ncbi:PaaI family thioesterase [Amycolatopsis sp. CA-161197]|uniref:PaaI family thioesterase n=1 Tax=Amycolatopsis sp. CA-161197 TaxID=3239922 RepID=UPI003D948FC9
MVAENGAARGIAAAQARLVKLAGSGTPDYEQIRRTVDTLVPFVNLAGVRIKELAAGTAVAEAPASPDMLNHLGTVHAGVLFLAAEVACAGAFSGAIAPRILHVRTFVLRDTRATFLRAAHGQIRAHGTITGPALAEAVQSKGEAQLDLSGKALLQDDNGALVAKVDFDYFCLLAAA